MDKLSHITFIALLLYANTAFAEPEIATIYANYKISGKDIAELKNSIHYSGLQDGHGNVFAAKTSTSFSWKYDFRISPDGCSIKSIDVEAEITYQLPELQNPSNLSKADQAEWARYLEATYEHERGHANLSIKTAKDIEINALNIPPKATCGETARTANMLISSLISRHERNNLVYDTQTAHGVAQGAVFAENNK